MIKKIVRVLNILILGMIIVALLSFGVVWKIVGEAVSDNGVITGESITGGKLEGLELSVFIPEKYQRVRAGEMLQFQVSLKNIQKAGRHDIQLDYFIEKNEIVIAYRRELKAVETQASFLSSIKVPEETLPGIYDIVVEINEEENAIATFYVKSSEVGQIRMYLIILIIAIIVVGGLIAFELHRLGSRK